MDVCSGSRPAIGPRFEVCISRVGEAPRAVVNVPAAAHVHELLSYPILGVFPCVEELPAPSAFQPDVGNIAGSPRPASDVYGHLGSA